MNTMRMRRKKNLVPRMEKCAAVHITEPQALRGRWQERFGRPAPIWLEIGCGKGRFVITMAQLHPELNFVAVERDPSALIGAMETVVREEIPNLLFCNCDAATLDTVFGPGEVDRLFLNFSDPWPPRNRAKRRLTHHNFLAVYALFLKPGAQIQMKTDDREAVRVFPAPDLPILACACLRSPLTCTVSRPENIMTEYEEKFAAQGMPIYPPCGHDTRE